MADIHKYVKMKEDIAREKAEDEAYTDESSETSDSSLEVDVVNDEVELDSGVESNKSFDSYQEVVKQQRCYECGLRPCAFVRYESELNDMYTELQTEVEDTDMSVEKKNSLFRFNAYQSANIWLGGARGKGNHTPIPKCMQDGICSIAPSDIGYTNFKAK